MKVVIAIDSLKNSLTSVEAGRAVEAGVRKAYGSQPVQIVVKPLADGGEGTVEALVEGMNGELRSAVVQVLWETMFLVLTDICPIRGRRSSKWPVLPVSA